MAAALRLYSAERCPYAARARITLAEKELDYQTVEIDLANRPAFMFEKNPTGTVPVLEDDDGFVLPESRAIMEYLEERFPEHALLPGDARERALVRVALDRFERFSGAYYGWRNRGEPAQRLDDELQKLDAALAEGYLANGRLTLADIGYVPWVLRAGRLGAPVRRFERVAAWLETLGRRPSVAAEAELVNGSSWPTGAAPPDLSLWRT